MTTTTDALTAHEREVIDDFENTLGAIPDCFDAIEDADLDTLTGLAPLLGNWWGHLDQLDGEIGGDGVYVLPASAAAREYLAVAFTAWFATRQRLLVAVAAAAGINIPQPDHHGGGEIETSNHSRGFFGFHDPGLFTATSKETNR